MLHIAYLLPCIYTLYGLIVVVTPRVRAFAVDGAASLLLTNDQLNTALSRYNGRFNASVKLQTLASTFDIA